jgi:hypothetical protein
MCGCSDCGLLDGAGEGCDGGYILVNFADEPCGFVQLANGEGTLFGVKDGLLRTSAIATHVVNFVMGHWM